MQQIKFKTFNDLSLGEHNAARNHVNRNECLRREHNAQKVNRNNNKNKNIKNKALNRSRLPSCD